MKSFFLLVALVAFAYAQSEACRTCETEWINCCAPLSNNTQANAQIKFEYLPTKYYPDYCNCTEQFGICLQKVGGSSCTGDVNLWKRYGLYCNAEATNCPKLANTQCMCSAAAATVPALLAAAVIVVLGLVR
eukprot:m51a1_g5627 putative C-tail anchored protein (132) ;mRNA; f:798234-798757